MTIPNELFSGYLIQYRILLVHFSLIYSLVFLSSLERAIIIITFNI